MYLPCPHCRRTFRIEAEGIGNRAAKLQCPSCGGQFLLQKSLDPQTEPIRSLGSPHPAPCPGTGAAQPSREIEAGFHAGTGVAEGPPADRETSSPALEPDHRKNRFAGKRWLLLPVFGLLLAVMGILVPAARKGADDPADGSSRAARRQTAELEAVGPGPVDPRMPGSHPSGQQEQTELATDAQRGQTPASDASLLLGMGLADPCQFVRTLQEPASKSPRPGDACGLYPYWIAYLSAENPTRRSCPIDAVFSETSQALRDQSLCAEGYAFLAAYYVQKRIVDRSQMFLEEARKRSAGGVWSKWVEFLFAQRILEDQENATVLLESLVAGYPDFTLARYFLAKMQIQGEEYDKAEGSFSVLQGHHPDKAEFGQIRNALASLRQAPPYSKERAAGLLVISRSFLSLREIGISETLLDRVMAGMPGRLTAEDQKTGFLLLGRLQELRGDTEGAYSSYQEALRIDPRFPDARQRLQDLLEKGKKPS